MASFFEKLTGASDEIKKEKLKIAKASPAKSGQAKKPKAKKDMKKDIEKIKEDEILEEKSSFAEATEDKNWLEEAEGEEGQLTIDVFQTPSEVVIKSTVAGVDPDNIDISITNDMVTIRGRRVKDEKVEAENYYYQELYWGTFSRSIILPVEVDVDRAKAGIKNGILTIRLPKIEKVRTKKIKVKLNE